MEVEKKSLLGVTFPPIIPLKQNDPETRDKIKALISVNFESMFEYCQSFGTKQPKAPAFDGYRVEQLFDLCKKNVTCSIRKKTVKLLFMSINSFSGYKSDGRIEMQHYTFQTELDGIKKSESFLLTEDFLKINDGLMAFFDGSEVEHNQHGTHSVKVTNWDHWKNIDRTSAQKYRNDIYPSFLKTIKRIVRFLEHRPLSVLDVGGGDGELALQIASIPNIKNVTVLDNHLLSIKSLDLKVSENKLTNVDGELVDITKYRHKKEPVDIITLCGVVAHQVLSQENSLKLIKRCKKWIKEDGFILIASCTAKYFTRKDYEELGYQVHNTAYIYPETSSSIEDEEIKVAIESFYILQKHLPRQRIKS